MARRKADSTPSGTEQTTAAETMKMPGKGLVREAATDLREAREGGGEIKDELRKKMAEHKTAGVHPAAIKLVEAKLDQAKESDRGLMAVATFFAHVDFYRDVLGLTELLKKQGQLFARPEAGETEEAADGQDGGGAVAAGDDERDLRPTHLRQVEAERETGRPQGSTPAKPH